MAQHTTSHLWLNTGIALLAVIVSGSSAIFSWKVAKLKDEAIGFTVSPTYNCSLEFSKEPSGGAVSVCNIITITNQSDTRLSIVKADAFETTDYNTVYRGGYSVIDELNGMKAVFPINIDGGSAVSYLARVPISVPSEIAEIASKLKPNATLNDLRLDAQNIGLDIIGNPISIRYIDAAKKNYVLSWGDAFKISRGIVSITTGRGNVFIARISFPPMPIEE